ncbi:unnamed protein product [Calypogeia fissa]
MLSEKSKNKFVWIEDP